MSMYGVKICTMSYTMYKKYTTKHNFGLKNTTSDLLAIIRGIKMFKMFRLGQVKIRKEIY